MKKTKLLSDVHRHPSNPRARRQTAKPEQDHHHSLIQLLSCESSRHACAQSESPRYHSRAARIEVINQGGICGFREKHSMGMFTKENDSIWEGLAGVRVEAVCFDC